MKLRTDPSTKKLIAKIVLLAITTLLVSKSVIEWQVKNNTSLSFTDQTLAGILMILFYFVLVDWAQTYWSK